jgi:hypothetical protein
MHVKEFVNDVMCAGPPDEWTLSSVMIMKMMMMMKSFTTDRYNNRRAKQTRDFLELFNCVLKFTSCSSSSSSEQLHIRDRPTVADLFLIKKTWGYCNFIFSSYYRTTLKRTNYLLENSP